jgi:Protein kinase domain
VGYESPDRSQRLLRPGAQTALLGKLAEAPEPVEPSAWETLLRPGVMVGRFELVREIGRGGFGVVWDATDREMGRSVAFKALRAGPGAARPDALLVAEAEAAARLAHSNIVHLYDLVKAEAGPFLIMKLLRGRTLSAWLAEKPLAPRAAVQVAEPASWPTRTARVGGADLLFQLGRGSSEGSAPPPLLLGSLTPSRIVNISPTPYGTAAASGT